MLFTLNVISGPINILIYFLKLVQLNGYLVSTVDIDGLVLQHQGISGHSVEYFPMHFPLFMD